MDGSEELFPFWKMTCFWANLHYIAHSSTRGFLTLTRAHGLVKDQEWLQMNGNRQLWYQEIQIMWKFWISTFNAFGHVRTGNIEMLKMTWFVLSFVQKVTLSIFKIWRARTCASWRARGRGLSVCWPMTWSLCVLNLVNLWWMNEMNEWMNEDMNDNVKSQNVINCNRVLQVNFDIWPHLTFDLLMWHLTPEYHGGQYRASTNQVWLQTGIWLESYQP